MRFCIFYNASLSASEKTLLMCETRTNRKIKTTSVSTMKSFLKQETYEILNKEVVDVDIIKT